MLGAVMGWFLLFCSLVWVVVGILNFLPAACYLQLDEEGLTSCVIFMRERVLWRQVIRFRVFRMPIVYAGRKIGTGFLRHVVADLDPNEQTDLKHRAQNRRKWGFDLFLATNYGLSSEGLAELLNKWREANASRN